jgi:hypothetical protein
MSFLTYSQIRLNPFVDDYQPTYLTIFYYKKKSVCIGRNYIFQIKIWPKFAKVKKHYNKAVNIT